MIEEWFLANAPGFTVGGIFTLAVMLINQERRIMALQDQIAVLIRRLDRP